MNILVKQQSILLSVLLTGLLTADTEALARRSKEDPEAYYKSPQSIQGKTVVIPTGTTFEGRLDHTIGSRSSAPGERFTITMSSPVLANGVDVLIPSGAQILGEVVEAIAGNKLKRKSKQQPKPTGKLRVQISGLRMPDGMTYPLVATLTGEVSGRGDGEADGLGGGVAYVGSSAGFAASQQDGSGRGRRGRGRQGVRSPEDALSDPIYGRGRSRQRRGGTGGATIRSLVKRGQDLYIDGGAPLSVRLDAPLKIGFNPVATGNPVIEPDQAQGKSFKASPAISPGGGLPAGDPLGADEPF